MSGRGDDAGPVGGPAWGGRDAAGAKQFISRSLREASEVLLLVLNDPGRVRRMDPKTLNKRLSSVLVSRAWLMRSDPPMARARYTALCHVLEIGLLLAQEIRREPAGEADASDMEREPRSKALPPSVLGSFLSAVGALAEVDVLGGVAKTDPLSLVARLLFAMRGMGFDTSWLVRWLQQWLDKGKETR